MLIVLYHDVVAGPLDDFDRERPRIPVGAFAEEMEWLCARFEVVPLDELLADGEDSRRVAVTFDDACAGVLDYAFPVLERLGVTAAVFAVTETLKPGGPRLLRHDELEIALRITRVRRIDLGFLDLRPRTFLCARDRALVLPRIKARLKELPEDERLRARDRLLEGLEVSPEECRAWGEARQAYRTLGRDELLRLMAAGWTVGSHTRTHRRLSGLGGEELESEILGSFEDLRSALGLARMPFAYPFGRPEHVGPRAPEIVERAGYTCGLTTVPGPNPAGTPRPLLRRVELKALREACGSGSRPRWLPAPTPAP